MLARSRARTRPSSSTITPLLRPEAVDLEESTGHRKIGVTVAAAEDRSTPARRRTCARLPSRHAASLLGVIENGAQRHRSRASRIARQERVDGDAIREPKHLGLVHRSFQPFRVERIAGEVEQRPRAVPLREYPRQPSTSSAGRAVNDAERFPAVISSPWDASPRASHLPSGDDPQQLPGGSDGSAPPPSPQAMTAAIQRPFIGEQSMTHGVDASMNQVQSTRVAAGRQSNGPSIRASSSCGPAHDSVLLLRQPSDHPIDGTVSHIRLIALIRPPVRPPLTTAEVAKGGRIGHAADGEADAAHGWCAAGQFRVTGDAKEAPARRYRLWL